MGGAAGFEFEGHSAQINSTDGFLHDRDVVELMVGNVSQQMWKLLNLASSVFLIMIITVFGDAYHFSLVMHACNIYCIIRAVVCSTSRIVTISSKQRTLQLFDNLFLTFPLVKLLCFPSRSCRSRELGGKHLLPLGIKPSFTESPILSRILVPVQL